MSDFSYVYVLCISYVARVLNVDKRTIQIPKGHCWVEGDNARLSQDSRYYGPVSTSTLSTYRLSQDRRFYGPVSTLSTVCTVVHV